MILYAGIGVDEGIYFYEARQILQGSIPYKDFFKMKPAGMIYIISLVFYFTNQDFIAARILTTLVGLLTSFFLYILAKEMYNQKIGFLAAAFYTFDPLVILFSYKVYMETYATIFLILSAYFTVIGKKRENIPYFFVSGILIGIAVFMKQPSLIMILVLAPFVFYSPNPKKSLKNRLWSFSLLIIGVLLVLSLILAYYLTTGLLNEFIYSNIIFHTQYTSSSWPLQLRFLVIGIIVKDNLLLWISGAFAIPLFLRNRRDVDILTLSFFLMTAISLFFLLTPHPHYFVQATPPLCILSSYSLIEFFRILTEQKVKLLGRYYLLLGLIISLLVSSILLSSISYVRSGTIHPTLEEQRIVAEYVKQRTSQDEYIFSTLPVYYFLSERTCPSKYIITSRTILEVLDTDIPDVLKTKEVRYAIITDGFIENSKIDENKAEIFNFVEINYQIEKIFSFHGDIVVIYRSISW
jgi:4-amino-4-deoxy-L-arabinose transferase-like glycosyltransferase